jgi:hypothetical protein
MVVAKVITSLLISSEIGRDVSAMLSMRFEELIQRKIYQHRIPEPEITELKDGSFKWLLDLTDHLDGSVEYCAALDQFLLLHEQFLCDLVSLETDRPFRLSALVQVDSKLAAFGLRAPRIPSELSRLQSFSFDYWVWHSCDADQANADAFDELKSRSDSDDQARK